MYIFVKKKKKRRDFWNPWHVGKETEELSFTIAPNGAVCSWNHSHSNIISTFLSSLKFNQVISLDLKLILDKHISIRIAPIWQKDQFSFA